ncbi:N-acetylglutamate synthase, mitochondrial-like [Elysia marginata]|uniref:N-acetylglutamate synthase, mitochondrial-like n=1 Tax=Elysia marginata TaxID=1093978 RepID=A0AAV4HCG6_9GAST|nr:N-acetylglutamate synthase, mitochondrial-like [Elysia marginata]
MLEQQGVFTRVLYPGCGVIMGDSEKAGMPEFAAEQLKLDPHILQSDFHTGHLPILLSYGETAAGQMFAVDTWTLTSRVAQLLQPIKVMLVNTQGGFLDEQGKVIANINLPSDLNTVEQKPWNTPDKVEMMEKVNNLLADLPTESSVVITSADTMLRELFSHRGSGTFFRCTEAVHKYESLEGIDLDRLRVLLHRSFKRPLGDSYFDDIVPHIHAIYLSETYFKKCEGSWHNPLWTVFWYGVQDPSLSSVLINEALTRANSFEEADKGLEVKDQSQAGNETAQREAFGSGAGE